MEQNLNLSLGQKLAMTAKLQQAIHILQLSAQDLRSVIETEYLENPALEMDEPPGETETAEQLTDQFSFEDIKALSDYLGEESQGKVVRDEVKQSVEAVALMQVTLGEMLEEQVNLAFSEKDDLRAAGYIVGCIDHKGYLTDGTDQIARSLGLSLERVERALAVIQTFDPSGVGARNLKECLTIQAKRQGIYQGLIAALLDKYLDEIAQSRYKAIAEKENCEPGDVQAAADIIRRLNPKPGAAYGAERPDYIVPDVVVRKIGGEYVVLVNDYGIPRLNISAAYKRSADFDQQTKKYIEGRVNSAAWLIKSIEQRRNTLYNVVADIVDKQRAFFDRGHDFLRPMLMKTVAESIDVHESTVSRTVANKYVETPHGVMPLKHFFTANLNLDGEELIASQVKAAIKRLIETEDRQKPWSDQQISDMLRKENMKISRRTVMKYREQMGYLSSVKRKRY